MRSNTKREAYSEEEKLPSKLAPNLASSSYISRPFDTWRWPKRQLSFGAQPPLLPTGLLYPISAIRHFGYCLLIGTARTIALKGGLLIGIVRTSDFGDCLLIGIVGTIDLGDGLLIGIVGAIDRVDTLWIGISRTIDVTDYKLFGTVWAIVFECCLLFASVCTIGPGGCSNNVICAGKKSSERVYSMEL